MKSQSHLIINRLYTGTLYIVHYDIFFCLFMFRELVFCSKILQTSRNWRAKRKTNKKNKQKMCSWLMWGISYVCTYVCVYVHIHCTLSVCHCATWLSQLIVNGMLCYEFRIFCFSTKFYSNKWRVQYLCFFFVSILLSSMIFFFICILTLNLNDDSAHMKIWF